MTFINYAEVNAQKLLVDPLAVAGSDVFLGGYRYVAATNAMRVADGTAPAVFHGGLAFTADGRLCVQSGATAAAAYVNGLALSNLGQVLVDSSAVPVGYVHGWPVAANGKLCVGGISTAVVMAHFTGAGQSITTPRTWEPAGPSFAIEALVKFTGPVAAWYTVFVANPVQPQVNLAFNTATGFFDTRTSDALHAITTMVSGTPPAFNVTPIWIRGVFNVSVVNYFSSPDRVTWTPMGGAMTAGGPLTGAAPPPLAVTVGGGDSFYGFAGWLGDIGRIQTWNDAAMTQPGFDFDPSKWVSGTTFVSGGDTWTLNGGVTISAASRAFGEGFSEGFA